MGHVLHLAPIIETQHYYCQTPVEGDAICGFRWTLDIPTVGKVAYQIACPTCGHSHTVTLRAPKPTRPPKPRPPKPKPICRHDSGHGYIDQLGRKRCSICGSKATDGKA